MERVKGVLNFFVTNFGPLLVFYGVHRFYGFKIALISSLFYSAVEIALHMIRKKTITRFFKFSVVMTFAFGIIDLRLGNAFFFKIEAGISNFLTAFFFGYSLLTPKPLIQEFAEQQNRASDLQSEDKTFFFRCLTVVWTLYFVVKGAFYIWIGFTMDLESSMIIRLVLGNASFWTLFFASIVLSRPLYNLMEKVGILPSQRHTTT